MKNLLLLSLLVPAICYSQLYVPKKAGSSKIIKSEQGLESILSQINNAKTAEELPGKFQIYCIDDVKVYKINKSEDEVTGEIKVEWKSDREIPSGTLITINGIYLTSVFPYRTHSDETDVKEIYPPSAKNSKKLYHSRVIFLISDELTENSEFISWFDCNYTFRYASNKPTKEYYPGHFLLDEWKKKMELIGKRAEHLAKLEKQKQKRIQDSLDAIQANLDEIERKRINDSLKIVREKKYEIWKKEMISKYGKENGELIINEKVKIGFTKEMCGEAWGAPIEVDKTIMRGIIMERWTYDFYLNYEYSFLYFVNGVLELIHES